MRKQIKIAVDATPSVGAGVCVIYEQGETPMYSVYARPHSYGTDPSTFEMKNAINVLKQFKCYFDQNTVVDLYCDNKAIESEDHPDTLILKRQIQQLEDRWSCDIAIGHDTIGDGNRYIQAANELSHRRKQQCEDILALLGAKPMRGH